MAYYEKAQKAAPLRTMAEMNPRCSVCSSARAWFSVDGGKTPLCGDHLPPDFFPHQRRAPRPRRAEPIAAPAPIVMPDFAEF